MAQRASQLIWSAQDGERAAGGSLAKELLGMVLLVEEAGTSSPATLFPSLIVRAS